MSPKRQKADVDWRKIDETNISATDVTFSSPLRREEKEADAKLIADPASVIAVVVNGLDITLRQNVDLASVISIERQHSH